LYAVVVGAKMDVMMEDELQAFACRFSLQRSPQQQRRAKEVAAAVDFYERGAG
ncbi:hypothetical protein AWZ03_014754, partial [Drosophila navojoa]